MKILASLCLVGLFLYPVAVRGQNRLSLYKQSYWHLVSGHPDKRVRVQLSVKYKALDLLNDPTQTEGLYIGYTLRLLWDMWNQSRSWPIDETNHKPEVFWRHRLSGKGWVSRHLGLQHLDLGYRHESNGRPIGPDSLDPGDIFTKSYFSAFLAGKHAWTGQALRLRLGWEARQFHILFENPDIASYLGRVAVDAEIDFRFLKMADGHYLFNENTFSFSTNSSAFHALRSRHPVLAPQRHFSWQAGYALGLDPLLRYVGVHASVNLFLQYFNGWGEFLSTYNDLREDRLYFGFSIHPTIPWEAVALP